MKSRVPLTQANLQYLAGVPRNRLNDWLDELLDSGVLDLEEGSGLAYRVPGAQRSADGPTTCEEYEKKRKLIEEAKERILARRAGKSTAKASSDDDRVEDTENLAIIKTEEEPEDESGEDDGGAGVASIVGKAALLASGKALVALDKPLSMLDRPEREGEKSLAVSGALSLLGPIGWLYAGSFREAVPATALAVAAYYVVPSFVLAPFMLVGALASGAIGLTYAWQFNRKKGRTPLFLRSKKKKNKE